MNILITASKIIDRAILLEEGGAIVIPCSSFKEMEKLRIRLYKLKKQLQGNYKDMALSLDIERKVSTNRWTLFITKDTNLSGVFVVEGGEAKPFELPEEAKEAELPELPEEEEEEAIPPSTNFDDIATGIEKLKN